MSIRAVFFDAFGTLCEIADKRAPYKPILKNWPRGLKDGYHTLLTQPQSLQELAIQAGCSDAVQETMVHNLQAEIHSLRLYPEVPVVLAELAQRGIKWAIVSNLAAPYRLIPTSL